MTETGLVLYVDYGMGTKQSRVRVLVADDHPLYRDGVVRAIKATPELELVGEAADGREALGEIKRLKPDVALIDMRMPGLEGQQVLDAVKRDGLSTRVVLLSAQVDSETVYRVVAAGASGYLSKDAGAREICQAIGAVARGATVLASEIQSGLASQIQRHAQLGNNNMRELTEREQQVLRLIAEGRSTSEIAKELYLSPATVKSHLSTLYDKLEVSERAAAVAEAMRRGLLE